MTKTTLSLTILAAAFATSPALWAAGAADSIQTAEPSVRMVPPGQNQTGAYLTLRNTGKRLLRFDAPPSTCSPFH